MLRVACGLILVCLLVGCSSSRAAGEDGGAGGGAVDAGADACAGVVVRTCIDGTMQNICVGPELPNGADRGEAAPYCDFGDGTCGYGSCKDAGLVMCAGTLCDVNEVCISTTKIAQDCQRQYADGGACPNGEPSVGGCCTTNYGTEHKCSLLPAACGGKASCECTTGMCDSLSKCSDTDGGVLCTYP
jgi:hypothetical protein